MACQLRSQGQEVALLCMLDTRVPTYFKNERGMRPYTLEEYMEERGVEKAKIRCMTEEEKLQCMYEMHQQDGLLPNGLDLTYVRSFLDNLMEILIAVANYEVPQFDGHLTLLRITPEAERAEDPTLKEERGSGEETRGKYMPEETGEDTTRYKVVINDEEQYSIWPIDRTFPPGWKEVGKSGSKAECLDYIKEVWTDMRPLSLRKRMENPQQP
jgi:MbtH protein